MSTLTISDFNEGFKLKRFSSLEITRDLLHNIDRKNKLYNSYIFINKDGALKQAKKADELRDNGKIFPLSGVPIAHKDIFCTLNMPTTCASKMLDQFISPYESTVSKLLLEAGADTNIQSNDGYTALMNAVQSSDIEMIKLLKLVHQRKTIKINEII